MNRKYIVFLCLVLVLIFIALKWLFIPQEATHSSNGDQQITSAKSKKQQSSIGFTEAQSPKANSSADSSDGMTLNYYPRLQPFNQEQEKLLNDPSEWFPAAEVLAKDGLSELDSIQAVQDLLDEYVVIVKQGGYPIGLNVEITNALLGDNPRRIALLSASHPRINDNGELADSWGNPYFFHANSLQDVYVRSAGPDGKMHNNDDLFSESVIDHSVRK